MKKSIPSSIQKAHLVVGFFILCFSISTFADPTSNQTAEPSWKEDYKLTSKEELWKFHGDPVVQKATDNTSLFILGIGTAAVLLTRPYDDEMRDKWGNNQKIKKSESQIGDFLGTGIPGIFIAGAQLTLDNNLDHGLSHSRALFFTAISTYALKYSFRRYRPGSQDRLSFPSGHTSTTFTTATSLYYAYGWKAAVPAYAAAVFTGLTRISDNAHWLSDTVGGAFVGILFGRATFYSRSEVLTHFMPLYSNDFKGLAWQSQF